MSIPIRPSFSVLMSVYWRDSPEFLALALQSLHSQSWLADEIVLVKDGPLSDALEAVIAEYVSQLPLVCLSLPENQGLGVALKLGLEKCRFDLVARMDADDISVPHRFERQMNFMQAHPQVDILGSSIAEFNSDPDQCETERRLPVEHEQLYAFAKWRSPMNHMTVMYRKSAVLSAGSYASITGLEDYDLWVRMLLSGARFHNLDEVLVFARKGNGMQARRGGLGYARCELALLSSFRRQGFLTFSQMCVRGIVRILPRLMPATWRTVLYERFLRIRQ